MYCFAITLHTFDVQVRERLAKTLVLKPAPHYDGYLMPQCGCITYDMDKYVDMNKCAHTLISSTFKTAQLQAANHTAPHLCTSIQGIVVAISLYFGHLPGKTWGATKPKTQLIPNGEAPNQRLVASRVPRPRSQTPSTGKAFLERVLLEMGCHTYLDVYASHIYV